MAKRTAIEVFMDRAKLAHKNVYENFYRKALLESVALKPALSGEYFSVNQSPAPHKNSVEIRGGLIIDRLPYRRRDENSAAQDRGISVLLNSEEIFKFSGKVSADTSFLWKSTVRVGYYQRIKDKWQTLLCVRYDYAKAYEAHPIFHAQLEAGTLNGDAVKVFNTGIPEILPIPNLHTRVRMPSANVIGATALLTLAADHLSGKTFREMLMVINSQPFFSPWRCDYSSLDDPTAMSGALSNIWYGGKSLV
ncbi:hypothetical protein [Herbaspirillum lusitanum]|uniref:hypothetical protein n=1 Tax=Herbaspirillum lusitanum TaxID=213312 RepID=UPI0022382FB2|nr:hypothetical protein [Herbaspirillum lusitanum]